VIPFAVWLNACATAAANVVFAPIAWLPGWISVTLSAMAAGLAMLIVFKHTSHQSAIRRTRNQIKANLFALSLFKDNLRVTVRAQLGLLRGAGVLIALAFVPTLVMALPMSLLLGQLSTWYQARPLRVGEDAVVTVNLQKTDNNSLSEPTLTTPASLALVGGPVRVPSKGMVCWNIRAMSAGHQELTVRTNGAEFTKEIAVGEGFMPTSLKRPEWSLAEVVLYPRERPIPPGSHIRSIEVDFRTRKSWTAGTDYWLGYWFFVSLATAFVARPLIGVEL